MGPGAGIGSAPGLPVAEALDRILGALTPLPAEVVPLTEALGRVLAEPLVTRLTQPPFAAAAMDGWAVRSEDLRSATGGDPVGLRRIGEAPAGHPFGGTVTPGATVRIYTGAALPAGADAVVMQEAVEDRGATARFSGPAAPGAFVRPAGLDFAAGDTLLPAGRRLTPRDIGLAAAANRPWLRVRRRPRVAVLATGDEIALPGDPIPAGGIVSSNALTLCALVAAAGGTAHHLGVAPDDPQALAALVADAAGADLLVTSGGASAGAYDLVRRAVGDDDHPPLVERVAMRPGGPMLFGRSGPVPWLGLPGTPVASYVAAVVFLVPGLRRLLGLAPVVAPRIVRLGAPLAANGPRQDHLRATLSPGADGKPVVVPFANQDSALTALLARADALIVRPPGAPALGAGACVPVIELTGDCIEL